MKLSSKLSKVTDSLTINMYDNGFMVEVTGRSTTDDWKTVKIMCQTLDEVHVVLAEAASMPRE